MWLSAAHVLQLGCAAILGHALQAPSLGITKTADASSVTVGQSIGFTITVNNAAGAGTAKGVKLTDTLLTVSGGSWAIDKLNSSPGCTITAGVLECPWGDLAAGNSRSVHITSSTTAAGTITNTASVAATNIAAPLASTQATIPIS